MAYKFLEPEYTDLFDSWKATPSQDTAQPLLQAVSPVVDTALRSYGGGTNPSQTLKSRAKILTLQAFNNYDPDRAKLRTHLMSHLRGLQRYSAKQQQIIGLPERVAIDVGRVRDAERELNDSLGRDPSLGELSDHIGMNPKRIGKLMKVRPGLTEGQTSVETGEGEDTLAPAVITPQTNDVWMDFIYHDLSPTDQLIFDHTIGYNNKRKLPKAEIARKIGISAGALSQRLAKIQAKLDMKENTGGLFT